MDLLSKNINDDNYVKNVSSNRLNTVYKILETNLGKKWREILIFGVILVLIFILVVIFL